MQLHIIIYSELIKWQGGREKWLKYFLKGICGNYTKINVYFLRKANKSNNHEQRNYYIPRDFQDYDNIHWYPITAFTWLDWIISTLVKSTLGIKSGDHVISVGSGPEAIVGSALKLLRRKIKYILWLRTVLKAELLGRKNRIFVRIAEIIEKVSLKVADIVIANGYDTKRHYQKITKKQIYVIPNAIDNFDDLSKIPLPKFNTPITIAFLGRFVRERGSDYFIELYTKIGNDQRFQFVVYGPTYGMDKILSKPNLVFKGPYHPEELPIILKNVDIVVFLLPSKGVHGGGVSHGLLEAMAAGRLIIAWKNTIVLSNNLLTDNNAILIDEGDLDKVVHILDDICNSPENFINKCIQAREHSQKFSVSNHIENFLRIVGICSNNQ